MAGRRRTLRKGKEGKEGKEGKAAAAARDEDGTEDGKAAAPAPQGVETADDAAFGEEEAFVSSLLDEAGGSLGVHASRKVPTAALADALLRVMERRMVPLKNKKEGGEPLVIRDLDVSRNRSCDRHFMARLLELLTKHGVVVQRFRFFGAKRVDDRALQVLADYLRRLDKRHVPWELHLSDCSFTERGLACLLKSIAGNAAFSQRDATSGRTRPLYLRVENNYVGSGALEQWLASPHVQPIWKVGGRRPHAEPTAKTRVQVLVLPTGLCSQKAGRPPVEEGQEEAHIMPRRMGKMGPRGSASAKLLEEEGSDGGEPEECVTSAANACVVAEDGSTEAGTDSALSDHCPSGQAEAEKADGSQSAAAPEVHGDLEEAAAEEDRLQPELLLGRIKGIMAVATELKAAVNSAMRVLDGRPGAGPAACWEWRQSIAAAENPAREAWRIAGMLERLQRQGYVGRERFRPQLSRTEDRRVLELAPLSSLCLASQVKPGEAGWVPTYRL